MLAYKDESIVSGTVELATGDRQETLDAFAMFDRFQPKEGHTILPLED